MQLLESGQPYRAVADQLRASLSSIVRWHQAYRKRGRDGLRPRPTPGRPPGLSRQQKKRLLALLVKGPLKAGYATDLWTLRRIGELIQRHFGVRYSIANVWKLMVAFRWSCQKPDKRARERNEAAIAHWKRYLWPGIKKSPKTSDASGLSG